MNKLKSILIISARIFLVVFLLVFLATPIYAITNPDAINFGTEDYYKVFYNVLETGDWLIVAEGYVLYNNLPTHAYETLRPDAAGIETNLTPSAGTNWSCVSDSNDVTYVWTASVSYVRDLYSLANTAVASGTIDSVTLYFRIINSGANTTYGYPQFYINGNFYNGSSQTATIGWSTKYEQFSTNPSTGNAWTWNDINNMQIGVSLLTSNAASEARCSEVYAVVNYTQTNLSDYTAEQAFIFELLSTTDAVTYASTTLQSYGDRPISIYLTAAQVTALGLTINTAYGVRIMGNPLIFATPTGNNVTAHLVPDDYVDQLLGVDGGVATDNPLRNGMIAMAKRMQTYDVPTNDYWTPVQGTSYLTVTGGDLFIEGIPNLNAMCPLLFQAGLSPLTEDVPNSQGSYGTGLTIAKQWGTSVANGLTALGSYLGLSQALAGSVVLIVVSIALAVFVYSKTESGISVLLMVGTTPFLGAWLGFMPLALAFVFTIVILVLLGYFFFSRGAL